MREFLQKTKWKLIQLGFLLLVVVLVLAYLHGRSVYQQKVAELERAQQTFGN